MVAGRFKVFIGHLIPFIPLSFQGEGEIEERGANPLFRCPVRLKYFFQGEGKRL